MRKILHISNSQKYSWNILLIREVSKPNYSEALKEGHIYDFDLLVIGVNPDNLACAIEAKQLGANVAVVHYSPSPSSTGIAFVYAIFVFSYPKCYSIIEPQKGRGIHSSNHLELTSEYQETERFNLFFLQFADIN